VTWCGASPLAPSADVPSPAGVAPLRIVLADDVPEIRSLLRRAFEVDPSVTVVGEAANGAEAIEVVCRTGAEVVLLDLAMPVMDGLQAIPEIRRLSPDTAIVVLSGFDASKMEQRALDLGATAYLSKGAGPDEILALVRRVAPERPRGPEESDPAPVAPAVSVEASYRRQHNLLPLLTHEVGNQLTVIQGFAEMLCEGLGHLPEETARQFAEAIVRNSLQMRRVLDAVSDLRQLDDGELSLDLAPLDLVPVVQETMDDLRAQLADRRVTMALPSRAVVTADSVRVRQALTNLVSNAAKFTGPGDLVSVQVAVRDDAVEVSVADNGPGIPPEREAELFRKFSRLGAKVSGSGIGLYLSRAIARAHGGDLVLVPQAIGCRFALRLPRRADDDSGVRAGGGRRRAGAEPAPAPSTT
jgi:signal transduction histidine kinase